MGRDESWMQAAFAEAEKARALGEVPVGALVIYEDRVVGRGFNRRETDHDPLAHAEILAIGEAAKTLGRWRLSGCELYVTLEPCPMCAGAIVNSRLDRLVFGATDPRAGAAGTVFDIVRDQRLNHQVEVVSGVLGEPCSRILSDFFADLRARRKAKTDQS
uniref:tRNA-specific adenosine deaminase n=1 Tax=uncultured myxobacterium HF0130_06F04 TaxID=723555 RepID=E7C2G0_9BACT|nr:cytosine/adenosine deaminases [uncultured myxobacterium HF0130_06F04]